MWRGIDVFSDALVFQMLASMGLACAGAWIILCVRKRSEGIGDYVTVGLMSFVASWIAGMLIFVPLIRWSPSNAHTFATIGIAFRVFVPVLVCARIAWLSGRRPRKMDAQYWLRVNGVTNGPWTGEQLVLAFNELQLTPGTEVCQVGKQRWERLELWMLSMG
jgi:hypothetical protein